MAGETIQIDGGYPVDISDSIIQILRYAQHIMSMKNMTMFIKEFWR